MNILSVVKDGDLSALQDAISRGDDVNSLDGVSWMWKSGCRAVNLRCHVIPYLSIVPKYWL